MSSTKYVFRSIGCSAMIACAVVLLPATPALAQLDTLPYTTDFDDLGRDFHESQVPFDTDNRGGRFESRPETTYGGTDPNNWVVELERNRGDISNLFFNVVSVPGQIVRFTFDLSARRDWGGNQSAVRVLLDGNVVDTIVPGQQFGFSTYNYYLNASTTLTRIELRAVNRNSLGALIDGMRADYAGDTDGDGVPDTTEGSGDTDGDGTPDFLDTDADNDGIPDNVEDSNTPPLSGNDSDNDGIDDALDADQTGGNDSNGNGIDDALEPTDSDGDGVPNHIDTDSDNDGIADVIEAGPDGSNPSDTDSDNTPDYLDTNSDNDGMLDADEDTSSPALSGNDTDNDGIDDALDIDQNPGDDANNNGINDALEPTDSDGDGTPNHLDLDSDNDTLSDVTEQGLPDVNNDGEIDPGSTETQNPPDSDNNGAPDYIQPNVIVPTEPTVNSQTTGNTRPTITGTADAGTTVTVVVSGATYAPVVNAAGQWSIDTANDTPTSGTFNPNINGDNEVVATSTHPTGGSSSDTTINELTIITDTDNDGIPDIIEGGGDSDGDGIPDSQDTDSDNDGIPDGDENTNTPPLSGTDSDGDGIDDAIDVDQTGGNDNNNNGIDDALEPTDNDSIPDLPEQGLPDVNGDGFIDPASTETQTPPDDDGDGDPNYIDVDSNGDGTNDIDDNNNGGADNNNDGMADDTTDTDGDGIPDAVDPTPNNNGGGAGGGGNPPSNAPPSGSGGALETAVSGSGLGLLGLLPLIGVLLLRRYAHRIIGRS